MCAWACAVAECVEISTNEEFRTVALRSPRSSDEEGEMVLHIQWNTLALSRGTE